MSNLVFVGDSFPSGLKMPTVIQGAGSSIQYRYIEFYTVRLRNKNTRMAYYRALNQFFDWLSHHDATLGLTQVNSIMVATYLETHQGSIPSRNQHLAAIRALFNWFVQAGMLTINPAQAVKGFKHKTKRGKTPVLSDREVLQILDSIETNHLIGVRDRALIATLFFSCARISAVLQMNVRDYFPIGDRFWFRLHEKGGHYHEVPVHAYAQGCMDTYLGRAKLQDKAKSPLFQTLPRGQHTLSGNRFKRQEAWGMIKRRAKQAGILTEVCVHSFRASGITNFLNNGGSREQAQQIAAHEDIRSTALYDRRPHLIAETEVDRIQL